MAAAPVPLDDLLALELCVERGAIELLADDDVATLLEARFRALADHGWDWRTALLLALEVERPVHELVPLAPAADALARLH